MLDEQSTDSKIESHAVGGESHFVSADPPAGGDAPVETAPAAEAPPKRTRTTRTRRTVAADTAETPAASAEAHVPVETSAPAEVHVREAAGAAEAQPDAQAHEAGEAHVSSFAPKGRTRKPATRRKPPADDGDLLPDFQANPAGAAAETAAGEAGHPGHPGHVADHEDTAVGPVDAGPAATDDPIGEALSALGRSRRSRRTRTTPEVPHADEVLVDLVHAIAAGPDEGSDDESDDASGDGETTPHRRRRRRGGRKRRRDASDALGEGGESDEADEPEAGADAADEGQEQSAADESGDDQTRHRRRRRRRRGEDTEGAADDDTEVVVKVREPRALKAKTTTPTGIDGSTRVEAKKQRRREGRMASRRRAPILSEAEFLARREQVDRKMLIRQREEYSQIAVIEDNILVEHYVDRASAASLIGNIYLGKVQNVLPGMEAAFIDIGRGRNAVLYAGEVDWDSFGEKGSSRKIEDVFAAGQFAIVQVSKDPVGAKGARLTSHISIPGRYVVYAPKGHISGISRKLSEVERNRLKTILDTMVTEKESVVIRTAAEGASEEELVRDVSRLKAQWEVIEKKASGRQSAQLLYAEPDLTMRIVRDLFTEDFGALIVDGNGGMEDAYETVSAYVAHVAPNLVERIQRWDHAASGNLFSQFRIDEQIAKALERKVHLPSGGSLVIDRTEAMTVIDVNTGKFTGSGGNLEATVTSNNLEAAEEIVRQLRLRDIGGIIIIDFIDMVLPTNRELLLRRLVECLGRDRTRHQVSEVTSLGLVQLTRKKVGTGLAEAFTKVCDTCHGTGSLRFDEPVDTQTQADGGERQGRRMHRR